MQKTEELIRFSCAAKLHIMEYFYKNAQRVLLSVRVDGRCARKVYLGAKARAVSVAALKTTYMKHEVESENFLGEVIQHLKGTLG